jgi:hypothetical protein
MLNLMPLRTVPLLNTAFEQSRFLELDSGGAAFCGGGESCDERGAGMILGLWGWDTLITSRGGCWGWGAGWG